MARSWILTGSPENYAATEAHGFSVIGLKERNRIRALKIEPGDRIVLYLNQDAEVLRDRLSAAAGAPAIG